MERTIRKISSFEEEEKLDNEYYASLSIEEKLQEFLSILYTELPEDAQTTHRLERVFTITKFS